MKTPKYKGLDKKVKRALKKEIEVRLKTQTLDVLKHMGYESKQSTRALEKNAKQLAKKLANIIDDNEKRVKGVSGPEKEQLNVSEPAKNNVPEFSSPQPILTSEDENSASGNKKPVIPSDTPVSPSALELAEKITEA